ncbi:MAG: hypothetical protein QNJ90_08715 [Planctomycetota bacterium]|nr:hypothetical protein [Planctomycetota bacterium]
MGRVFVILAAVMSVLALLAVALAPQVPAPPALAADLPVAPPEPAPPILRGRAPAEVEVGPDIEVAEEEVVEELVLVDPKDAPPDPVERGSCRLTIHLTVAGEDEQSFDTDIDLWRINEPGNEHWTHGDRRIARLETKDGRAEAADLAPGRYRIHAHKQRKGSKDPVAFRVEGGDTTITLALPAPRRFKVRLRVYDQAGDFVLRGHKQSGGVSSYSSFTDRNPDWVESRRLREGILNGSISIGCGCGSGRGRGAKIAVESENGTFDLFAMRESERYRSYSRTWHLLPEDGTKVSVYGRSDTARDRVFVGVTLPLRELHDAIRLPDGTRAIDAGARITAECDAVLVKKDGAEPDWRRIPIQVRVRLKGYADLDFKHALDGPLEDRVLDVLP